MFEFGISQTASKQLEGFMLGLFHNFMATE